MIIGSVSVHKKFLLLVLLIVGFGFLLNGCDSEVEKEYYNISGLVLDSQGEGIEGVKIHFSRGFGTAETDKKGNWNKADLEGSVDITPVKEGYSFSPENKTVTKEAEGLQFIGFKGEYDNYEVTFSDPDFGEITAQVSGEKITSGTMVKEGSDVEFEVKPDHGYQVKIWILNGVNIEDETQSSFIYENLDQDIQVSVELTDEFDSDNIPGVPIYLNSPIEGVVDPENNPNDLYSVYLEAGEQIKIVFEDKGDTTNRDREAIIFLLTPDSTCIEWEELHTILDADRSYRNYYQHWGAEITYTPAVSGTYYIWVNAVGDHTPYILSVEEKEKSYHAPGIDDIPGESIGVGSHTGVVDARTHRNNLYSIDLEAGQKYILTFEDEGDTEKRNRETNFILLSPDSTSIEWEELHTILDADRSYRNYTQHWGAEITYTPAVSGTYYIWVNAVEDHTPYTLSIVEAPYLYNAPGIDDIPGESIGVGSHTGVVDARTHRNNLYSIDLEAGQKYILTFEDEGDTEKRDRETNFILLSPDSTSIEWSELYTILDIDRSYRNYTQHWGAEITYTPAVSGTYYIWVNAVEDHTPYTLSIVEAPYLYNAPGIDDIPGESIGLGSHTGVVDARTHRNNLYSIDLEAGQKYILTFEDEGETEKRDRETNFILLSPDSTSIKESELYTILDIDRSYRNYTQYWGAEITYTPAVSGTYYIWVNAVEDHTPYTLSIVEAPYLYNAPGIDDIPGESIGVGSHTGVVDARTHPDNLYSIDLEAGQKYILTFEDEGETEKRDRETNFILLSPDSTSIKESELYTILDIDRSYRNYTQHWGAEITYTPAVSDTYYIWVNAVGDHTPYTLVIHKAP